MIGKVIRTVIATVFLTYSSVQAEVRFAPVFSDNMVLQREVEIPVRGTAIDEEQVAVLFNGKEYVSDVRNGRWQVELPPMPAGGNFKLSIKGGAVLEYVTFGDIWLCAGQSNMDSVIETYKKTFPALYEGHPVEEHDQIRIFRAARVPVDVPEEFIEREHRFSEGWYRIAKKTKTRLFSATGYFFGLYLAEELDVPIGLIQSCRGGTPITAWMPPGSLDAREEYANILEEYRQAVQSWPSRKPAFEQQVRDWERKKAAGEKVGWKPEAPLGPESVKRPYALHNGMIAPLYELPIKGVLWYQGEGNAKDRAGSLQYEMLLQDLVSLWRKNWDNEKMPFLVVQLPGFGNTLKNPRTTENWPWIRESQKNIEQLEHCATICIIDSGMQKDIHPPYKENVGKRLAFAARRLVYGQECAPASPEFDFQTLEGESTVITFKNCGKGLTAGKPTLKETVVEDGEVLGFLVLDDEGKYRRARGKIIAPDKVRVEHPGIENPASIRYAWENFPSCNLYGGDDIPAFPFRTDTFSGAL